MNLNHLKISLAKEVFAEIWFILIIFVLALLMFHFLRFLPSLTDLLIKWWVDIWNLSKANLTKGTVAAH